MAQKPSTLSPSGLMRLVTLRARPKVKDNTPQSYSLDSPCFQIWGFKGHLENAIVPSPVTGTLQSHTSL